MFYSKPGIHTLEGVATRFLSQHSQLGPDNLTKEREEGIFCHNRNKSKKKKKRENEISSFDLICSFGVRCPFANRNTETTPTPVSFNTAQIKTPWTPCWTLINNTKTH